MAKIPTSHFRSGISTSVSSDPTISPSQAGAVFKGVQNVGAGIWHFLPLKTGETLS